MVIINGISSLRNAKRPRKEGEQALPVPEETAGTTVKPTEIPPQVAPVSAFDPKLRGGGGLGAAAGSPTDPFSARTLEESADIINSKIDAEVAKAEEVPTVESPEKKAVVVKVPTRKDRIEAIEKELNLEVKKIEGEAARLTKTEDIAALQQQAKKEITDIEDEGKLEEEERARLGEEFKSEQLEERITGARAIAEKEGISLTAAAQRFDKREQAKANLDPEKTRTFDNIVEQVTDPDFDPQDAYELAIAEYEKDGVDADDMANANKAIASVYGQNFADEAQDNFLINTRKIDHAIVQGNRKLIDAKKVGETIKSGQAGAMVTNSYLKTIFDTDQSLVPDAISKILASDATDDAKRQASAFAQDFFRDVETGIGVAEKDSFLTEAKFKAGLGTPEERAAFRSGIRELQELQEKPEDFILTEAKFKAGMGTPEQRKQFEDGVRELEKIKQESKAGEPNFDQAKFEFGVSKEYEDQSKEFIDVQNAYQRVNASAGAKTAAGDLGLIFNYMKMLDPASVVREGEFATAQNAAGVPDRIRAFYNKIQTGERLTDNQRNDFTGRAEDLFGEQKINQDRRFAQFGEQMDKFGGRPDILRDLVDPRFKTEEPQGVADLTPEDIDFFDTLTADELNELSTEELDAIIQYKETVGEAKETEAAVPEETPSGNIRPKDEVAKVAPLTPEIAETDPVEFVAEQEGFREEAYQDSAGVWTIGYGTTKINGNPVQPGDTISEPAAKKEIQGEISRLEEEVDKTFGNTLNEFQKVGLVSFMYNLGMSIFDKPEAQMLKTAIDEGDIDTIRDQWVQYINAGGKPIAGLQNRRERELAQFLTNIA